MHVASAPPPPHPPPPPPPPAPAPAPPLPCPSIPPRSSSGSGWCRSWAQRRRPSGCRRYPYSHWCRCTGTWRRSPARRHDDVTTWLVRAITSLSGVNHINAVPYISGLQKAIVSRGRPNHTAYFSHNSEKSRTISESTYGRTYHYVNYNKLISSWIITAYELAMAPGQERQQIIEYPGVHFPHIKMCQDLKNYIYLVL